MNYKQGRYCKKERFCLDCNKKLIGNNNPKRCKKCNQKFLHPNGRQYPKCLDCGIVLKTYHSKRCKYCAHLGKLSSQFKDGRTLKKDYYTKYVTNRRKTDTNFRISGNLRSRIRTALRGICKSKTTVKLLGCSIEKLKKHLEFQFKQGMSWKNYGQWHIDHIIPCIKFDLVKKSEQYKCFNYKNLQPLWAKDNFKKNKKIF
jgi:hypothetical protein